MNAPKLAGIIGGAVTLALCLVVVGIVAASMVRDSKTVRKLNRRAASSSSSSSEVAAALPVLSALPKAPKQVRIRVLNVCRLPWRQPPVSSTLYHNTDVLLLQEVFRTPSLLFEDPLPKLLSAAPPGIFPSASVSPVPQRLGTLTNSGLAGVGCWPWGLQWVDGASLPWPRPPDSMADKSVAVFELCYFDRPVGVRLATTHMQAGLGEEVTRKAQLEVVFDLCRRAGVHLLAGDFNAEREWLLAHAPGWARHIPSEDGSPTTLDGQQLDHVFLLQPSPLPPPPALLIRTNPQVGADMDTDHAALDITLPLGA